MNAYEMTACFSDPQSLLSSALDIGSLDQFKFALNQGASPNMVDKNNGMSIFQKACQKPGSSEFIEICIKNGCDVNEVNIFYLLHIVDYF